MSHLSHHIIPFYQMAPLLQRHEEENTPMHYIMPQMLNYELKKPNFINLHQDIVQIPQDHASIDL